MTAVTPVGTYDAPDNTTHTGTAYKTQIDNSMRAGQRQTDRFAPHAAAVPNMTIVADPGYLWDGTTLVEQAAQTSGTITAPVGNPRIDRLVADNITGAISIVTGTVAASPVAPAIPSGKFPIAQIACFVGMTSITNNIISDERAFPSVPNGSFPTILASGSTTNTSNMQITFPTAAYSAYEIYVTFAPRTNNVQLIGQFDDTTGGIPNGGHSWSYTETLSSSSSQNLLHNNATWVQFANSINGAGGSLKITLTAPQTTTLYINGNWTAAWLDQAGSAAWNAQGGFRAQGSNRMVKLTFGMSSGNMDGTYRVVGIP